MITTIDLANHTNHNDIVGADVDKIWRMNVIDDDNDDDDDSDSCYGYLTKVPRSYTELAYSSEPDSSCFTKHVLLPMCLLFNVHLVLWNTDNTRDVMGSSFAGMKTPIFLNTRYIKVRGLKQCWNTFKISSLVRSFGSSFVSFRFVRSFVCWFVRLLYIISRNGFINI